MSDNHRSLRHVGAAEKADAAQALARARAGLSVTTSEVAKLAAEVLANPPPLMAAARRFLSAVGTPDARAAAVEFLALLADPPPD
jgi:hypothetical protein